MAMNIDRYMVNLFFEIRRNVPSKHRQEMTISNPQLGNQMIELYRSLDDDNLKLLISVFLKRAGEEWYSKIRPKKVWYRSDGKANQAKLEAKPRSGAKPKSKMIYRGQIVE